MPRPPSKARYQYDTARLRHAIRQVLPAVVQKLYQLAIAGDVQAAKILMDRALPPLQPVREAITLEGDTQKALKADLLAKVANGDIAPREALAILEVLSHMPKSKQEDAEDTARGNALMERIVKMLYGLDDDASALQSGGHGPGVK